jgi:hypothetical protein
MEEAIAKLKPSRILPTPKTEAAEKKKRSA